MKDIERYKHLNEYLKRKIWRTHFKKICIDGGFTCPNRDGTLWIWWGVFIVVKRVQEN